MIDISNYEKVNYDLYFEILVTTKQEIVDLIRDDILVSTINYNNSFTYVTRYKQSLYIL